MGHSLLTTGWLEFLQNWNEIQVSREKKGRKYALYQKTHADGEE